MTYVERSLHIDAAPAAVWRVMMDIERWPEWTASMRKLVRQQPGDLREGSTARVAMAGAIATTWRVTQLDEGRSFTWETAMMPGARAIASHVIEPDGGGSRVTLTVRTKGPLAPLLNPIMGPLSRRNVRLEIEGLKRRCEQASA